MNVYETIVILNSNLPDEDVTAYSQRIADMITEAGGSALKTENWGKRKLAYEVKKQAKGHYMMFLYKAPAALINKLEGLFKVSDQVIKFMVVKLEKKQMNATLKSLAAAQAAAEAAAAAPAAAEATEAVATETAPAPAEG